MRKGYILLLLLGMLATLGVTPVRADDADHSAAGRVRSVTHDPASVTIFNKDGQTTYPVDLWRMSDDTRRLLWGLRTGDEVSLQLVFSQRWNQWRVVNVERSAVADPPLKRDISRELDSL